MHQLLQIEITILTISSVFQHLNTPKKINQIYKIITWLLQVCMEFMRNTFYILGIIHSKIVYIQRKCSAKYKIFKQIAFYRILTHLLGLAQFLQLTHKHNDNDDDNDNAPFSIYTFHSNCPWKMFISCKCPNKIKRFRCAFVKEFTHTCKYMPETFIWLYYLACQRTTAIRKEFVFHKENSQLTRTRGHTKREIESRTNAIKNPKNFCIKWNISASILYICIFWWKL